MKLLLTRHGQSQWQTGTASEPDAPLSALGKLQAHRLGEYLARRERLTRIVASPLRRARQTAEIAALYLNLPVTFDADLREFDNWDAANPPSSTTMWQPDAATPLHPEYLAFCTRIQEALERMIDGGVADRNILIVAHGGTIGTLLRLLLGAPTMRIWTPNTALHSLRWMEEFWLLRYTNNQEHLPQPLRSS